jgi:hypothetical protein
MADSDGYASTFLHLLGLWMSNGTKPAGFATLWRDFGRRQSVEPAGACPARRDQPAPAQLLRADYGSGDQAGQASITHPAGARRLPGGTRARLVRVGTRGGRAVDRRPSQRYHRCLPLGDAGTACRPHPDHRRESAPDRRAGRRAPGAAGPGCGGYRAQIRSAGDSPGNGCHRPPGHAAARRGVRLRRPGPATALDRANSVGPATEHADAWQCQIASGAEQDAGRGRGRVRADPAPAATSARHPRLGGQLPGQGRRRGPRPDRRRIRGATPRDRGGRVCLPRRPCQVSARPFPAEPAGRPGLDRAAVHLERPQRPAGPRAGRHHCLAGPENGVI